MKEPKCDEVLLGLKTDGFAHLSEPLTFSAFESVVKQMGTIELRSEIKIDDAQAQLLQATRKVKKRPSPYKAEALGFHSDNPRMDVLAWYCREQDENAGATLLIDTCDLPSYFSETELANLCQINLWYSMRNRDSDEEQLFQEPLATIKNSACYIYYQPWLFLDCYSNDQIRLLEQFSAYLAHKQESQTIAVKLGQRECLFIDNRRILHGRDSIARDSRRHLTRFFIKTYHSIRD